MKIEMNIAQLKQVIRKLPLKQRTKLLEELQKENLEQQFDRMFDRIDARLKKHPISSKEVDKIVEEARQEYHDQSRH